MEIRSGSRLPLYFALALVEHGMTAVSEAAEGRCQALGHDGQGGGELQEEPGGPQELGAVRQVGVRIPVRRTVGRQLLLHSDRLELLEPADARRFHLAASPVSPCLRDAFVTNARKPEQQLRAVVVCISLRSTRK